MSNAFVVFDNLKANYFSDKWFEKPVKSIDKAFIFRRKCDASQMLGRCNCDKNRYSIIGYAPQQALKPKFKLVRARPDTPYYYGDWEEHILYHGDMKAAELIRDKIAQQLNRHPDYIKIVEIKESQRPEWDNYLLGLAKVVSQRSPDGQTKHGCVIVDKDHRILGTGYNGFPRGLDDSSLPNMRPEKYDWILHSEVNAILNCNACLEGATAYITGRPCTPCAMFMWQAGIRNVICGGTYCWQNNKEKDIELFNKFVNKSGMKITYVKPDLNWLFDLADTLRKPAEEV